MAEADPPGASGRKVFVVLLRELRCLLKAVRKVAGDAGQQLSDEQIMSVAYHCLFYGVGPNSSHILKISLPEFDPCFVNAIEKELDDDDAKEKVRKERGFLYKPFEGHQFRLGHYYRHFYQMVNYVDQQPDDLEINKYEYVKTMRAQLSTHEQAILLVNSRTPIGRNWWSNNLIVRYGLVKNIPPGFFEKSEVDMGKLFEPGYFEWEESRTR